MRPRRIQRRVDPASNSGVNEPISREPAAREQGQRTPPQGLDRVIFPAASITKGDVLRFYQCVAPRLLRYLRGRPITIQSLPEDLIDPASPSQNVLNEDTVLIEDAPTLLRLVNEGAVTFYIPLSTMDHADRPDFVLFDVVPGQRPFADAVTAARQIHLLLDALGVRSCPKTSGQAGVHVLARWQAAGGYGEARAWALWVAQCAATLSDIATTQRLDALRSGRVFIDVSPNTPGHPVVPPYVLRPTPQATVSMPLRWSELRRSLDSMQFNLRTVLEGWDSHLRDPMRRILRA